MADWAGLLRQAVKIGADLLFSGNGRAEDRSAGTRASPEPTRPARTGEDGVRTASTADRARTIVYAPDLDGAADPGEIVWAWVPFEENDGRGKDRPLLVVGRGGGGSGGGGGVRLLGLMLSSQHD